MTAALRSAGRVADVAVRPRGTINGGRIQDLRGEQAVNGPLVTGVLQDDQHQGNHGESMVRAIVAASGLEPREVVGQAIGKDLYIGFPGPRETIKHPQILVSIKSWSNPSLGNDGSWKYPLKVSNYNFLARMPDMRPYLFLAIVPPAAIGYSDASHQRLRLNTAVYWCSFEGVDPLVNVDPKSKKTVSVPKSNLVTATTLEALLRGDEANAVVAP